MCEIAISIARTLGLCAFFVHTGVISHTTAFNLKHTPIVHQDYDCDVNAHFCSCPF